MVLCAPMLKIADLPMPVWAVRQVDEIISFSGFGATMVPGGMKEYLASQNFEGNPLTSDRERFLRNQSVSRWRRSSPWTAHDRLGACGA